ncbi:MAG: hypothetical protein CMF48_05755 [Legionellales bacterium]|nr:hypothetical protein [Legionellales bacterium]|tara:strand:+ start:408 stop:1034 length:627 start_codon:yes stop_codon:yes gene_type:complete
MRDKGQKAAELILLFIGIPLLLYISHSNRLILGTLIFASIGCCLYLITHQYPFMSRVSVTKRAIWQTSVVTIVLIAVILGFAYYWSPERWLSFPLHQPQIWGLVMLLYPFISAIPQELVYRSFFFHRYEHLFRSPGWLIVVNAVVFAMAHSMFRNPIAIIFTFCGGLIFAYIYHRYRSLILVSLVHAILGNAVFTSGLGMYFYHGRIT